MKMKKKSLLFFMSLLFNAPQVAAIQYVEGVVAAVTGYVSVATVGILYKLKKQTGSPGGTFSYTELINNPEFQKILAEELKKKRDESTIKLAGNNSNHKPNHKPGAGTSKPATVSIHVGHKSGDYTPDPGTDKKLSPARNREPRNSPKSDNTKPHRSGCHCCSKQY